MPTSSPPSVAVLMATFNGARWLDEQISSILRQDGVNPRILVSDDMSEEATLSMLTSRHEAGDLELLPRGRKFGNANRNFMHLIRTAPVADADFVAFADQDDIWVEQKLARAISQLKATGGHAYSSDVLAFWPDGKQHRIVKATPQTELDHLFESPGPGCTFVFPASTFHQLRAWALEAGYELDDAKVHDWLLYAWARERGLTWTIDDFPGLLYRQHGGNEIGANHGWKAALRRFSELRSGGYRCDVLQIARAVGHQSRDMERLSRFSAMDRLMLMLRARHFRRLPRDVAVLFVTFAFMRRKD